MTIERDEANDRFTISITHKELTKVSIALAGVLAAETKVQMAIIKSFRKMLYTALKEGKAGNEQG